MKETKQQKFWKSDFGRSYTDRNMMELGVWDMSYKKIFGLTRSEMNRNFLRGRKIDNILEVGCNIGNQLRLLQNNGYKNVFGVEMQKDAVEKAKMIVKGVNIIEGDAFDLPFKDSFFDLVFTSGVLIHIHPCDLKKAMAEIVRVSKKYIWGFEYFDLKCRGIEYRGHEDCLWANDFCGLFLKYFSGLELVKRRRFKRLDNGKSDEMYLIKNCKLNNKSIKKKYDKR